MNPSFVNTGSARMENLAVGDHLSFTSYVKVLQIKGSNLAVIDQRGVEFAINQSGSHEESLVNQTMHSASQADKLVKLNRTELVALMLSAGDTIMTVTYRKQVDPKKAFESVKTGNVLKSHAEQQKAFEKALKGEQRILVGHILKEEGGMGRTLFYDLEAKGPRLVDHRGLESVIYKGTKYEVN